MGEAKFREMCRTSFFTQRLVEAWSALPGVAVEIDMIQEAFRETLGSAEITAILIVYRQMRSV